MLGNIQGTLQKVSEFTRCCKSGAAIEIFQFRQCKAQLRPRHT